MRESDQESCCWTKACLWQTQGKKELGPNYWEVIQNKAIACSYVLPQNSVFFETISKTITEMGLKRKEVISQP